jgi:hypothetical protein
MTGVNGKREWYSEAGSRGNKIFNKPTSGQRLIFIVNF